MDHFNPPDHTASLERTPVPLVLFLKPACLTLQQAHEEARQRHGEDGLRAEVGQYGGEGRHGAPGGRRQQEDLLTPHAVETQNGHPDVASTLTPGLVAVKRPWDNIISVANFVWLMCGNLNKFNDGKHNFF